MDARTSDVYAGGKSTSLAARDSNAEPPRADDSRETTKKRGRPKEPKEPKEPRAAAPREKVRRTTRDSRQRAQTVDVDRQCGVPLTAPDGQLTGALCARSLTCKTHSMGAKRAVLGRSQLYDVLLTAYQKKNQLKSGERGSGGPRGRGARTAVAAGALESDSDDASRLPDSEEISEVLRGAMMSAPLPIDRAVVVPTRLRSQRISLSEFLYKATSQVPPPPASASPLAAVIASTQSIVGRCVIFDKYANTQSVRPSQAFAFERLSHRPQVDQRPVARPNPPRMNAGATPQRDAQPPSR